MASLIDLQQPVPNGGIQSINFFNGRLLSARDLTLEQSAYREADRRLGKAVGDGVAYGLEVTRAAKSSKESPAVSVSAGLAINRRGQTLMLDARADVALVRTASATVRSKIFSECQPLQTGAYVANAGVYLLTIAPAEINAGRAMTNGMNPAAATCNSDTTVSAVQFRLIQIDPPITSAELNDEGHLRNVVAYKCFGVEESSRFLKDPFGKTVSEWGLLDGLRPKQLTDCEVPLAVLRWTKDGIKFIDAWSVRRQLAHTSAGEWPPFECEAALATAEARLLQFRDQLEDLRSSNPAQVQALAVFNYLPPVGLLPLSSANSTGFNKNTFFNGITVRDEVFIDVAQVDELVRSSTLYGAIDLSEHQVIWLYRVRENVLGKSLTHPFIIFASGHMPPMGTGRYNLGHWNYSNYAIL